MKKRTIIINWKWNFDNGVASEAEVVAWNAGILSWKPHSSTEPLPDLAPKYDLSAGSDYDRVLKLDFDLSELRVLERQEARKSVAKTLINWLQPGPNHLCLFLFHHKAEHISLRKNFMGKNEQEYVRYYSFEGGNDTSIYGKKALLNGAGTAYHTEAGDAAAVWKPGEGAFEISASCFSHVWDQNWYRTLRKLGEMRELCYYAQLPGFKTETVVEAQAMAASLVATYDKGKQNASHRKSRPGEPDFFEECADLVKQIDRHLEREGETFLSALDAFASASTYDPDALNRHMHQLIANWNHEIYT